MNSHMFRANRLIQGKYLVLIVLGLVLLCMPTYMSAEKDVILDAMTDEMNRSMKSLQIEKMEKPYYLEYTITDTRLLNIEAQFGKLNYSRNTHSRTLRVDLRVGDYQLDNTGFMNRRSMFSSTRFGSGSIVRENDYDAIRHDIWLQTDRLYKAVLEQLAAKRGFIKTQAQMEDIPDFSKEKSLKAIAPLKTMKVEREKWEAIARDLSAIFKKFPAIHHSGIALQVKLDHKYYVNSEGTMLRQPHPLVSLVAYASTQAEDGMKLKHHVPFYAPDISSLPSEKEMAAGIRKMAKELTALASAPVLDKYIGPVLFTGQASAELFTQVFAPHLSGERPPLVEEPRMTRMIHTSELAQRLSRKVLPKEISVTDDPTINTYKTHALIGSYKADDQGIAAVPVKLVENGVLKYLLMSRRPRKEIANSNGHARGTARGNPQTFIGNLFITADKGKSYKELKEELLEFCRDQQAEFGLIVKTVDNPTITGSDFSISSILMRSSGSEPKITAPVLLYRVYAKDGREELVRGISFSDITVKSLKDIEAVGNDYYVHHRLLTPPGRQSSFGVFTGSSRFNGVPGSIVAPSVLFEELELKKSSESKKNPPLLVHPFFRK
jgi:predicted Zn-dependent protease